MSPFWSTVDVAHDVEGELVPLGDRPGRAPLLPDDAATTLTLSSPSFTAFRIMSMQWFSLVTMIARLRILPLSL